MQKPRLFGMNGFLLFLISFFYFTARAQQEGNLILIDAEGKQVFTIRVGDQLFASTGQGHLVLSHLKDSLYRLNLRFPKTSVPEQVFPVSVHGKDLGFQLRGADSTWVLFNWQTAEIILPVHQTDSSRILEMGVKRDDGFSRLMAAVVNDTAVLYNSYTGAGFGGDTISSVAHPATPPSAGVMISGVKDSQLPNASPASADVVLRGGRDSLDTFKPQPSVAKSQPPVQSVPPLPDSAGKTIKTSSPSNGETGGQNLPSAAVNTSVPAELGTGLPKHQPEIHPEIKKLRDVNLKISRKMVFLDLGRDGKTDTITLFVFFETLDTLQKKKPVAENMAVKRPYPVDSAGIQVKNKSVQKTAVPGCSQLAADADAETLRSAILQANTDQDKISAASQAFSQKCYLVSQIRLLASLLVSDKSRYRLMEAANSHIADREHFPELADMYTDKNFQKKFLIMAGKRS